MIEGDSGEEAHRLNPFLRPDGVLAVLHVGEDLYFDPAQVAIGYVRTAEARGTTVLSHTTVTRVNVVGGRVSCRCCARRASWSIAAACRR